MTLLIYFASLSAGTLLVSNLAAVKLWDCFGIAVDGGLVLFPVTYILGDLIIEFYGEKVSRTIITSGFLINVIAAAVFYIVIALPAYPGWDMQDAYQAVLGFSPRIIAGSLLAYIASNLLNNRVFERMRGQDTLFGQSFIARALGSSVAARLADSAIFETVAFLGVLPFREFLAQAVFAYGAGMVLELLLAPLEAWIQRRLKRYAEVQL